MDTTLSIRVFEWRGALHLVIDRIHPAPRRRFAQRDRLAGFSAAPVQPVPEDVAALWALEQITAWVNAGCPYALRVAGSAPPSGGSRGARANGAPTGNRPHPVLPSQTAPSPVEHRTSAASSLDGLNPPGFTPELPLGL